MRRKHSDHDKYWPEWIEHSTHVMAIALDENCRVMQFNRSCSKVLPTTEGQVASSVRLLAGDQQAIDLKLLSLSDLPMSKIHAWFKTGDSCTMVGSDWELSRMSLGEESYFIIMHTVLTPQGRECYDEDEKDHYERCFIQQQSELEEIAFIQAHEFRRPLANMLAIFDLIDLNLREEGINIDEILNLLDLLKVSVQEADEVIAKIVLKTANSRWVKVANRLDV
ncbi:hypothetical protein N6H18_17250 [Reichenbachiella agarivorans]|uniref:PAS fold-containing protein n=1 Tax=Reichenbachiella agarivorans TaxID=2979464 RepID=A0ABY6CNJ8_9BACT|nr:hypothetical protein [Reichenbachiella agarivorans]UXP32092.1 hypothetical protein N6H18_17250 [Reichenbachiella agarivorans]